METTEEEQLTIPCCPKLETSPISDIGSSGIKFSIYMSRDLFSSHEDRVDPHGNIRNFCESILLTRHFEQSRQAEAQG